MTDREIAIRSVQHFLYCPHRWGLLEIDCAWSENVFVTKANLLHERVHNPDKHYTANGKKVFTSVKVFNNLPKYNLYGVTDCIELMESKNGVPISGLPGKYNLCIVEYKPTKPKNKDYHEEDFMQIFTQKLCVDYVFGCDSDAVLYYADVKKRVKLPVKEQFQECNKRLLQVLEEMRERLDSGAIPKMRVGQNCNGCSLKEVCMPMKKKPVSFLDSLNKIRLQENDEDVLYETEENK